MARVVARDKSGTSRNSGVMV